MPDDPHHALLPPTQGHEHTRLLETELARIQASPTSKLSALDLSRYELSPDQEPDDASLPSHLGRARAAHAYISSRRVHLALLDAYGRNAWLVGNWQLEGMVKAAEGELAASRRALDVAAVRRRAGQEAVAGEVVALEDTWRKGVARVLETEAAAEVLRRHVLEARRRLG